MRQVLSASENEGLRLDSLLFVPECSAIATEGVKRPWEQRGLQLPRKAEVAEKEGARHTPAPAGRPAPAQSRRDSRSVSCASLGYPVMTRSLTWQSLN